MQRTTGTLISVPRYSVILLVRRTNVMRLGPFCEWSLDIFRWGSEFKTWMRRCDNCRAYGFGKRCPTVVAIFRCMNDLSASICLYYSDQRLCLVRETSVNGFLTCCDEAKKYYVDFSLWKCTQNLCPPDLLGTVPIFGGREKCQTVVTFNGS